MMKYLQITTVLALFFFFVLFKNIVKGDEGNTQVGLGNKIIAPSPTDTPTDTPPPTPAPGTTAVPTLTKAPTPTPAGKFKNGTYTGSVEDAFYGNIQVQAVITNGKLSDVLFLDYPQDNRTSISINQQALPMLKAEAISAQSANIDMISGASDTSPAFAKSLASALSLAK